MYALNSDLKTIFGLYRTIYSRRMCLLSQQAYFFLLFDRKVLEILTLLVF